MPNMMRCPARGDRSPSPVGGDGIAGQPEERPAVLLLTHLGEVFELHVVQQMNAQRVHGECVDRKVDSVDGAGRGVVVAVAPQHGGLSLGDELERGRMQAGPCGRHVPRSELVSPATVADAHEQQITRPDVKMLRVLGRAELCVRDAVARLEPWLSP